MAKLERVLVANRGEIAVRVIRTLRDLGMTSIAVFSEADRLSLHVLLADEAYPIGPAAAAHSYLSFERILEAARQSRADAVHPGYGFLAENAEFARACQEAGRVWVGPPPKAISALGDKLAARELARKAGVPLIPGSEALGNLAAARAFARRQGLPLMLKAAAGGGGKGMRVVREDAELEAAWELARGEARAAFGDDRVYLERFFDRPRHVEAQVVADGRGRVVFLGERECSVQRRHQKLFEETPCPALDDPGRRALGEAACRLCREAGYVGAGTVEFILDESGKHHFLEVNTRLQVEHPVTEMVTGLDLVAEQLRAAAGEALSFGGEPPAPRGHAMEARITCEDPLRGFLPSAGTVRRLRLPQGPGVRNDSGIYRGAEVAVHYDPLMAKLVVWGRDRDEAARRMARALDEYVLEGVHSTVPFHRWLVGRPEFRAGRLHTGFIDQHLRPEQLASAGGREDVAMIAAALHARAERGRVSLPVDGAAGGRGASPWKWSLRAGRATSRRSP
jgi:acetyl-CoA carboxylase biotin carboxylase subunit